MCSAKYPASPVTDTLLPICMGGCLVCLGIRLMCKQLATSGGEAVPVKIGGFLGSLLVALIKQLIGHALNATPVCEFKIQSINSEEHNSIQSKEEEQVFIQLV